MTGRTSYFKQMFCARCCERLGYSIGESAIYDPGRDDAVELCEPCFFEEDREIEKAGTNDLPDTLRRYRDNIRRLEA